MQSSKIAIFIKIQFDKSYFGLRSSSVQNFLNVPKRSLVRIKCSHIFKKLLMQPKKETKADSEIKAQTTV